MSSKRHKKKVYTIMLIPDSAENVKTFKLPIWWMQTLALVSAILLLTVIIGLGWSVLSTGSLSKEKQQMTVEAIKLYDENEYLRKTNDELTETVKVLGTQIEEKTIQEQAKEEETAEEAKKFIPSNYPLDRSAALISEFNGEAEAENEKGVVFQAESGATVCAAGEGKVLEVGQDEIYGSVVKIDHGNDYISIYYNASEMKIQKGDEVKKGTSLFVISSEENKLSFCVLYKDNYIDPMSIMEVYG